MINGIAFLMVPSYQRCECADGGCKVHAGASCRVKVAGNYTGVRRVDMDDEGQIFCHACAEDALASGLFTTEEEEG